MSKHLVLMLFLVLRFNIHSMEQKCVGTQDEKNKNINIKQTNPVESLTNLCCEFYAHADEKCLDNQLSFSRVINGKINSDVSEKFIKYINKDFIADCQEDLFDKNINTIVKFNIFFAYLIYIMKKGQMNKKKN